MPENSSANKRLAQALKDRIDNNRYEFYFSSRSIEGDFVVERRFYYFVDLSFLYHDKNEKCNFTPVYDVMNSLDTMLISHGSRPLYLDQVEYNTETDEVTCLGFVGNGVNLLLEYFWSDHVVNLSKDPNILIKKITITQFLNLCEATFLNPVLSFRE